MKKNIIKSINCPPDPSGTFESMRAYGYSFSEAISDLIDNSITAKAKNVWIQMNYNKEDSWILIKDDGIGMDQEELINAMTIGKKPVDNVRKIEDHGRFGFGLKTASISQAKRLTVRSKNTKKDQCEAVWDLDEVMQNGWQLYLTALDNNSVKRIGSIEKTGTNVLWEKPDRLVPNSSVESKIGFETLGKNLNHLLGCRYHRIIESGKLNLYYNGTKIYFFNPFKLPTMEFKELGKSTYGNVRVSAYLLPHDTKFKNKPKDLAYAEGFKGMFDHQGIYLYRNNRLMIMGDWLNSGLSKTEVSKLLRIKIDIDNTNDEEWRIDVRKCNAIIPDSILPDLKRLISSCKEEAKKRYTFRVAKIVNKTAQKHEEVEFIEIWDQNVTRNGTLYKINKEHPIIKSLKNSILSTAKNKELGIAVNKLLDSVLSNIENMARIPISKSIAEYSESTFITQEPYESEQHKKIEFKLLTDALEKLGFNESEIKYILQNSII
jgi:predicted CoA-binding protein